MLLYFNKTFTGNSDPLDKSCVKPKTRLDLHYLEKLQLIVSEANKSIFYTTHAKSNTYDDVISGPDDFYSLCPQFSRFVLNGIYNIYFKVNNYPRARVEHPHFPSLCHFFEEQFYV